MNRNDLEKLADAWGVETEYYDIWGNLRTVSDETLVSILTSMGIYPEKDGAYMRKSSPPSWDLDPVYVFKENARPFNIPITIPVGADLSVRPVELEWIIRDESGGEKSGTFRPCDKEYLLSIDSYLTGSGYYELQVLEKAPSDNSPNPTHSTYSTVIITPETCYTPSGLAGSGRIFGLGVQLYALRSSKNWGMGDFTDLKHLLRLSKEHGVDILGINPINSLFPQNPEHASPYSPSSRLFLNHLYLDPEVIQDFQEAGHIKKKMNSPGFQARLARLRETDHVDYSGVAKAKQEILEALWEHFRKRHLETGSERAMEFRDFQKRGGEVLFYYGVFEALAEYFHEKDPSLWGWPVWPEEYRAPESLEVREFSKNHMDRVEFFHYLQWQAEMQLASVGNLSMELGLKAGLYMDIPVSVDGGGFDVWVNQDVFALGARVGAPPDDFNLKGQDWGIPPFIPHKLRENAYLPFIAMLRANMKYAGAIRLDHVMGLMRLFWVPSGKTPVYGSYVRYPFEDLLGILALESQRNSCLIIGEDLGTVPDEVRSALGAMGVFSYRVSYFEKDRDGNFKPSGHYPSQALCTVSTHDLPTLWGYWIKRDIALRTELDLYPSEDHKTNQITGRAEDKGKLLLRLEEEGLLPKGMERDPGLVTKMTHELSLAIHSYMANTPSKVFIMQLEDILGQTDQVNFPGTTTQYPNWRKKLSLGLEALGDDEKFISIMKTVMAIRKTE